MNSTQRTVGGLFRSGVVMTMLVLSSYATAEAVTARVAKDVGERAKAVSNATRHLQGPGFVDPMLTAENVNDGLLAVDLDYKGWALLDNNQKNDFLERVNAAALNANGGVSIDIQVSVNGTKVAASTFSGGQQFLRLTQ